MFFDDKVGVAKNVERAKGCVLSPSVVALTNCYFLLNNILPNPTFSLPQTY